VVCEKKKRKEGAEDARISARFIFRGRKRFTKLVTLRFGDHLLRNTEAYTHHKLSYILTVMETFL